MTLQELIKKYIPRRYQANELAESERKLIKVQQKIVQAVLRLRGEYGRLEK